MMRARSFAPMLHHGYRALLRVPGKGAMLLAVLYALVSLPLGCGPSAGRGPSGAELDHARAGTAHELQPDRPEVLLAGEPLSLLPVEADDAVLGMPGALVTLIAFVDFECPFCARAHQTVRELASSYDRSDLRIVYKNNPLPFHPSARPAAHAAQAVLSLGGPDLYFAYVARLFSDQRSLRESQLIALAEEVGLSRGAFVGAFRSAKREHEVRNDIELARSVGATSTPSFRINGARLDGAQSLETFRKLVDRELAAVRALLASGTPRERLYLQRVEENLRADPAHDPRQRKAHAPARDAALDADVAYRVPVASSPTRGPSDALVTIVEFQDFECPFCKRVQPTVEEVLRRYDGRVRLVFKHNPLSFHPRAQPAAMLTLEARAQKGEAGFWKTTGLLWERSPALEQADLLDVARQAGLNLARVQTALAKNKHQAAIDADVELADDVEARSTPHFFVNGRRLTGAQPLAAFTELIDAELAKAEALVASGVPKSILYERVLEKAVAPQAPETKSIAPPGAEQPSRGAATAPVVIQVFSDFECPFCKRAKTTLEALEKEFGGAVRLVWRNNPLPFHPNARPAAAAALEARAQRGNREFWRMHDLLFAGQGEPGGLARDRLERYARDLGLDVVRFGKALDDGRHDAVIDADIALAKSAGIQGTPCFVINGYFVSGAQPLVKFRKVVRRALLEAKAKPAR